VKKNEKNILALTGIVIFLMFVYFLLISFSFSQVVNASSKIAIAEFETDYDLRDYQDDLNNYLLDYIVMYFDDNVIEIKERLRYVDILRERALSSERRETLRNNLQADFLILPRVSQFDVSESKSLTFSILNSNNKNFKVDIGIKKVVVSLEIAARVVDLRTGNIKTGFLVDKKEAFEVSSIQINSKNVFKEKGGVISSEVFKPATEELSLLILAEIEDLGEEYGQERAKIVEVAPYGIEEYVIARINKDSTRFREGREITIYKSGSVGGKIPIASGEIIESDVYFIPIQKHTYNQKLEIKKNDSVNAKY
jgi:hypothetical protein